MRKDLTLEDLLSFTGHHFKCPVCGEDFQYNPRTGRRGQWAHFICDTGPHRAHYGKTIVSSQFNGARVCSLPCNNAVQLKRGAQPVLCDTMAEIISEKESL